MHKFVSANDRRWFLRKIAFGAAAFSTTGLLAEELQRTPAQTEGPFYPNNLPLDTDNDLLIVNDGLTPAVGDVTHLTGRILSAAGEPVRNAVVEIWQCDSNGVYLHTQGGPRDRLDANFQGFGRFLTGSDGNYYFRTIKPVPYGPRTPHIHFAVYQGGKRALTTQCYIRGEKQNERDGVLRSMRDPQAADLLMVDFNPLPESNIGELTANFEIVLGTTPEQS
ncbi:MAG: protocatechuate 3,4-dioxygenase [Pirellulales bacterium]